MSDQEFAQDLGALIAHRDGCCGDPAACALCRDDLNAELPLSPYDEPDAPEDVEDDADLEALFREIGGEGPNA